MPLRFPKIKLKNFQDSEIVADSADLAELKLISNLQNQKKNTFYFKDNNRGHAIQELIEID